MPCLRAASGAGATRQERGRLARKFPMGFLNSEGFAKDRVTALVLAGGPPALLMRHGAYASMPTHEHTRLRSPKTLSMRPTAGQNLWSCSHGAG